ncbi:MAG: nucleoid-associated protein [Bacteroidota bacterium]|nr:nucleoid-associated protein [Bacteroidota bacterium]
MADLKEIGHNIVLKNFVIHKLIKDAGVRRTVLKLANTTLAITDKEKKFIGRVNYAYNKKSGPTFGIFDKGNGFQDALQKMIDGDIDFLTFSTESMKYYDKAIVQSAPATGGFVIFAYFTNTDKQCDYLLVLAINNKDGYSFNEDNLTLEGIKDVDLSKIDIASLINITKWQNVEAERDVESKTYLSFVRGNKTLSFYFMSFIGCANKQTSTESSKRLMQALDKYCKYKEYDKKKTTDIKNAISQFGIECINQKKGISLAAISALVDSENPYEFQEFASDDENEVNDVISGDRAIFKNIKLTKYKDDNMIIEFNNQLLLSKQIIYDKKKHILTINRIELDL